MLFTCLNDVLKIKDIWFISDKIKKYSSINGTCCQPSMPSRMLLENWIY